MNTKMSTGEALFTLFIVVPLSMIFSGFAISMLWDWFIVATFGLKALTIAQAIGLGLVVAYMAVPMRKGDDSWTLGEKIAIAIFKPLIFLGLGWVVHLFM